MKPKALQKAKIIIHGWTRPTERKVQVLKQAIRRNVARKGSEEISQILENGLRKFDFEAFGKEFRQAVAKQNSEIGKKQTRIATKYALEAVGVGYSKKEQALRKRIREITDRAAVLAMFTANKKTSQEFIDDQLRRMQEELYSELGTVKGNLFAARFISIVRKFARERQKPF